MASSDPSRRQVLQQESLDLQKQSDKVSKYYGNGSTAKQLANAGLSALSGNISGSAVELASRTAVNVLQQKVAYELGQHAKSTKSQGSLEHIAGHALIGAAGGAASGGIDGANIATTALSGSIGGGGGELLGYTAGKAFGVNPDSTQSTKDTTREAINAVVGMSSMATGLDAHTASNSSNMALDNNSMVAVWEQGPEIAMQQLKKTAKKSVASSLAGPVAELALPIVAAYGVYELSSSLVEAYYSDEPSSDSHIADNTLPQSVKDNVHSMSSHKQLPSQTSFPALPNNGKDSQGVPPLPAVEPKPEILTTPSHSGEKITKYINPGVSSKDKEQLSKPLVTPIPEGIAKPYMLRENNKSSYHEAPDKLTAFPDASAVKKKTPVQGGGRLRHRWKDKSGKIYEWDYKKGAVEVFDKTGKKHLGEFDAVTGMRIGKPVPGRKIEK